MSAPGGHGPDDCGRARPQRDLALTTTNRSSSSCRLGPPPVSAGGSADGAQWQWGSSALEDGGGRLELSEGSSTVQTARASLVAAFQASSRAIMLAVLPVPMGDSSSTVLVGFTGAAG
jgi:hypothetical protein